MKNEVSSYLENISLLLLGILFLAFPLIFTTITTDAFSIPKQALLGGAVLISLVLLAAKMIADGKLRLRRTPFDLPLWIFLIISLISAVIAQNRADALTAYATMFFAALLYFVVINIAKQKSSVAFLIAALILGASITSLVHTFAFLKIYVLPYPITQTATFTTLGSLLDHAMYLAFVLPFSLTLALPIFADFKTQSAIKKSAPFLIASIIIAIDLSIAIYQLSKALPLPILPLETGFQTAFAAISQDTGRVLPGFLFGSGIGTYLTDFTRFKQVTYNFNPQLWSFVFTRSSNFILELLATTGVLGVTAFSFLLIRIFQAVRATRVFIAPLIIVVIAAFLLPFSFVGLAAFFFVLSLFAAYTGLNPNNQYFDIEMYFVAFKNSLIPVSGSPVDINGTTMPHKSGTKALSVVFFVITLVLTGAFGFFAASYVYSDITFQHSFVAASQNNSMQTYNDQVNAIKIFPWRDGFYRVYSQTNLALANSLATTLLNQQKTGGSNEQQTQETIYTLIQQSINAARTATQLSPYTSVNWQNLSNIYRSLIGFGQNAESFSITTMQQAIALDQNNPQGYLNLGGIYYQLQQWDNAQREFLIAIKLKSDYANAYYNLGHTFEEKGDLQQAITQYQTVKTLIANDPTNAQKIAAEIEVLQKKIGDARQSEEQNKQTTAESTSAAQNQPPLDINKPAAQLPKQKPQVEIPGPEQSSTTPSPTLSPTPTP